MHWIDIPLLYSQLFTYIWSIPRECRMQQIDVVWKSFEESILTFEDWVFKRIWTSTCHELTHPVLLTVIRAFIWNLSQNKWSYMTILFRFFSSPCLVRLQDPIQDGSCACCTCGLSLGLRGWCVPGPCDFFRESCDGKNGRQPAHKCPKTSSESELLQQVAACN